MAVVVVVVVAVVSVEPVTSLVVLVVFQYLRQKNYFMFVKVTQSNR